MLEINHLLSACLAAASLAAAAQVGAAENAAVSCSVSVDSLHDANLVDAYRQDFVVAEGVDFVDDFSTPTRTRRFTASLVRSAGDWRVSIDYFNDVGVFVAIGLNTALTIHGGSGIESTSGSHATYISSGVTPSVAGGNHLTNHVLSCRRA